ncbi:hypothetical protein WKK05_01125 [Nostoc sp. UHCC 0302]|uniref:hypothetical protein n=1 Tax=Nostoc sp. UHCC 0302 TaxID=3134896 RepID=UPI00311CADF3
MRGNRAKSRFNYRLLYPSGEASYAKRPAHISKTGKKFALTNLATDIQLSLLISSVISINISSSGSAIAFITSQNKNITSKFQLAKIQ